MLIQEDNLDLQPVIDKSTEMVHQRLDTYYLAKVDGDPAYPNMKSELLRYFAG